MTESRNIYIDGNDLSVYKARIIHDLSLLELSLESKKQKDLLKHAKPFIMQLLKGTKRILWSDVEFIDGIIEHLGLSYFEFENRSVWPVIDGEIIQIGSEESGYMKQPRRVVSKVYVARLADNLTVIEEKQNKHIA